MSWDSQRLLGYVETIQLILGVTNIRYNRGAATFTQKKHLRTHLHQKYGKVMFWWILAVILCVTNIYLWQNLWWCWYLSPEGLNVYNFIIYHCQECEHSRDLWRLIWVFAVCICFFFACIQPVPQVRTLNFRLAMPLYKVRLRAKIWNRFNQSPHLDRRQSKTLLTIDERGSKIARNSVFDCHASPVGRHLAIESEITFSIAA